MARVVASGRFTQGAECAALEQELAASLPSLPQGWQAVVCASGTDALHLALRAAGVGAGDVVLTSAFTFFATAGAILLAGARPEFVDIDPESFTLSPAALEAALYGPAAGARTGRVAAILPVHLYGRMAAMEAIGELARKAGVPVVEDACQAIGATAPVASIAGTFHRAAGAWGLAGCFSFYPTKNLGAMGEGGMVSTCDAAMAERLRLLRAHGSRRRYEHETFGWNSRMHELQAAVLRAKLPHLEAWNRRRRAIARAYGELLQGVEGVVTPAVVEGHVFHQYVIRVQRREELRAYLRQHGIGTEVYYPAPLDRQPALAAYAPPAPLAEAARASREVLALPMFPELTDAEAGRVASVLREFYAC